MWKELQSRFCIDVDSGTADPDFQLSMSCKSICGSLVELKEDPASIASSDDVVDLVHETARTYVSPLISVLLSMDTNRHPDANCHADIFCRAENSIWQWRTPILPCSVHNTLLPSHSPASWKSRISRSIFVQAIMDSWTTQRQIGGNMQNESSATRTETGLFLHFKVFRNFCDRWKMRTYQRNKR